MKTTVYWNQYNLGDCIWHLLYLRKLSKAYPGESFILHCNLQYHSQLAEIVLDMPMVNLAPLEPRPPEAVACWIGPHHRGHPLWNDIIAFLIDWFAHLSSVTGHISPIRERRDMLCDYPAILDSWEMHLDWLIINSQPMSGQFAHNHNDMNALIAKLASRGYRIATTVPTGIPGVECTTVFEMTVTAIGHLSLRVPNLLAVATGPIWPTCNVWNQRKFENRIILINDIHVDYGEKWEHFGSIQAAEQHLMNKGVIDRA